MSRKEQPETNRLSQDVVSPNVAEVCVLDEMGLHARPAARLAQEAQKFESDVQLVRDEQFVDAKSVLDILSLAAGQGCGLLIHAEGEDAPEALKSLVAFFNNKLDGVA